ncbi:hypothetical protein SCOCK_10376 [Actinacidiphila cocklensis]|uniref:Uncharacterized protein n=1 Tax=Actinacidiphila cocklensis TaxID=887465 RepID=A0A9W4DJ03_9ACTN|nr:hypothetical protein SCOCK_10376 [Actinacidiphila cocklensis]
MSTASWRSPSPSATAPTSRSRRLRRPGVRACCHERAAGPLGVGERPPAGSRRGVKVADMLDARERVTFGGRPVPGARGPVARMILRSGQGGRLPRARADQRVGRSRRARGGRPAEVR